MNPDPNLYSSPNPNPSPNPDPDQARAEAVAAEAELEAVRREMAAVEAAGRQQVCCQAP